MAPTVASEHTTQTGPSRKFMPTTNDLFKKAEAHVRAGRHDAAITAYDAILRRDPGDTRARYRMAVVHLMKGQYAEGPIRRR